MKPERKLDQRLRAEKRREAMKPLRCLIFGHITKDNQSPYGTFCVRCGETEISPDGQSIWSYRDWHGILGAPYYWLRERASRVCFPRCRNCRKPIFFHRVEERFCSQRCADIWIPF